ncbi:type I polyketide synthase [Actinokineospora inagensis]|uniref:type I polyketide synthase n=1 Tax=Actinokineospora inagensis TaxID=103730 RepID=UPI000687667D|nr:type I polyketide synthase [Actinokineospora inagensis]
MSSIAVVGIGCRLPSLLDSLAEIWRAFLDGVDAIREVPANRWNAAEWADLPRWGGFLDDIAGFDAGFFGISPIEARQMDPQQRLALEVAWSALEDARVAPGGLAGSRTGVYFGAMWQEYALFTGGDPTAIRAHSATGWDNSVIPARIAHALGLRGPAMTVATASSSSLVAVHLAVQGLRSGETDVALAGGVNLMLHPHTSVAMTKLGTQSPDGRCRAFDAEGNGYVRGEGCGVVVLRRLSDALADGDRIYAVVHGSAVNNDGATDGLTAPSLDAQIDVLRSAWQDAGIPPSEVSYSEAHGTGTPLGDTVEAAALGRVFGPDRAEPLRIGSAKTNFGHLEPAAGILGFIKAALAIHNGVIPPSLHFRTPNPDIDFTGLEVVTEHHAWTGSRFAGVSSFGFGGTNAHVALGPAPDQPVPSSATDQPVCLVVSGATEQALVRNAERLADHLTDSTSLTDVAYSLATTRSHLAVRGAVVARTVDEAITGLRALDGRQAADRGKVVFVFPGQGGQWTGMGRNLLDQSDVFRAAIEDCDAALRPHTGWSVLAFLLGETDLDDTRVDVVQPALFAVYLGLAAVWRSWGVEPAAVVGHSQGEVSAAVVSGALSVDEGARVVALRSQAVRDRAVPGAMGLVERPVDEVRDRIKPYGDALSVAVVNTKQSTVVSGDTDAVTRFLAEMESDGAFCQRVKVDYASHSAHMDALLPGLRADLADVDTAPAEIPFHSSVTGEPGATPDADYWCRNLREPVRFDLALDRLARTGHDVFVEVSPHPVLGVALADTDGLVVGSLRRDLGGRDQLLRALGDLHSGGHPVDWTRVLGAGHRVDLPGYAFQHRRYWLDQEDDVPTDLSWADDVAALAESERLPWLVDLVLREAETVLGKPVRPDEVLREQGFDSLTVVELRNRLVDRTGAALPSALAFSYPTPQAIAGLLLDRVGTQPTTVQQAAPKPTDDAIAIVGMACKLPGGIESPEAFWELLSAGREAIGPYPARWGDWDLRALDDKYTRAGGFLQDAEMFDAGFFGVSPRQAKAMDPQQRLALEVVWEALERANLRPNDLAGSKTGVYLGAMSSDYDVERRWDVGAIDGNQLTGNATSLVSGRIAYTLGLEGPAITVDTACSASLVALHLASTALRRGECDLALAGGVTVMSTPQMFVEFSRLNGLAGDGRCKSFAEEADGTSWAEGCGVLVLKRLDAAKRDGDRVLAVLRGTAVNQDGRSQGLTAPNGLAQQRVVRDAIADARLTPRDIDAIEAHGTGTVLGDPVEADALTAVFAGRQRPLYLGSAKSNLGHTQAAAGVVGVIKMVLALRHERLPSTLHATRPSTHVDWAGSSLELLRDGRPWRRGSRVRRAGVSSFSMSGTNAHAVIEEAPGAAPAPPPITGAYPLVISGVDESSLRAQASRWAEWLDNSVPLRDVAYTAAVSRTHFPVRAAVIGQSVAEVVDGLRAVAAGESHSVMAGGSSGPLWTIAESHLDGHSVDWDRVFAGARKVDVPTYAFARTRYWVERPRGTASIVHPWLDGMTTLAGMPGYLFTGRVSLDEQPWLADHRVSGAVYVPGAGLVDLALSVSRSVGAGAVAELTLLEPLVLAEPRRLQITVGAADSRGRYAFALFSQAEDTVDSLAWERHATGELATPSGSTSIPVAPVAEPVDLGGFYSRTQEVGLDYGQAFQGLRELAREGGAFQGRVELPESLVPGGYGLHPALLDSALHVVVAGLLESGSVSGPPLPFLWTDVELYQTGCTELVVRGEITLGEDTDRVSLVLIDPAGSLVARVGGLQLRRPRPAEHLYRVEFDAVQLAESGPSNARRVVFPGKGGVATLRELQESLGDEQAELVWVTRRGVSASPDDDVSGWDSGAVWGLVRAARAEQPDRVLRVVDVDSDSPDFLARALDGSDEPELVLRGESAFVPRLRPIKDDVLTLSGDWRLTIRERGRLDAFTIESSDDVGPSSGEVLVEVRAAGVNFRDVLNALDIVPAPRLGLECAGVVLEVGADVTNVRPGDRVMGLAMGTFSRTARMDVSRVVRIPESLTFAEAATIPVAFITALHALSDVVPGERVLVHSAAGGVGMAAVRLAHLRGAEVFATASPGKWPAVRALGLDNAHIRSSRDTGFEAAWSDGVDVVLNSLAGEFTDASLRLLREGGRFYEIGKTDLRSQVPVGVEYHAYDVTTDIPPERFSAMLTELAVLFDKGVLEPLPFEAYDVRHAPEALRYMQQARHVGKVVLTMPRGLDPEGTVLITGGLGELGRALADHLVREYGVRRLVLSSRRGGAGPAAESIVRDLEALGASVRVVACDVANRDEVAALVDSEESWTGVFHLAGVLDDGLVPGFTEDRLRRVLAPKVDGARHLDELTERLDLAAFVLFSSVAGTVGTAGQSGYAAANASLDALAARRRKRGLAGISLAFGLWEQSGVGMTAHLGKAELGRLRRQGVGTLSVEEGLRALDVALTRPEPYLVPVRLELASLRHALGAARPPAVLRALVRTAPLDTMDTRAEHRETVVLDVVRGEVAAVLGLPGPEAVPPDKTLRSLGLDSLTMVELRNRLSTRAKLKLPATLAFDYPTADAIAALLRERGV